MTTTRTSLRFGALMASALLAALAAAEVQARSLTLDERVAAQQAIDQVYWAHRTWPDANPHPKPPLATESTEPAARAKILRYLSLSTAVESGRHAPLTGAELQHEMERMAAETKAPGTLRELFAALHDDPSLIAECLARPALVSRLAQAAGIHGDGQELEDGDDATIEPPVAGYSLPAIGGAGCANDSWAISILTDGTGARVPAARQLHTAVWTGAEMVVWGGRAGTNALNNGGVYQPATDSWLVSSLTNGGGTNVPTARSRHTAVWTGTEVIVWGGVSAAGTALDTGGRYNPATDSWASSTLVNGTGTNVPAARQFHTVVWTGTTMIIWGGTPDTSANALNNGGIFNPNTDGWEVSLLTNGAGSNVPTARFDHTAVWSLETGEMIIWGGRNSSNNPLDTGGIYAPPGTDSWAVTNLNNASGARVPSPRFWHTAVWTGSEMIIWGGTTGGATPVQINTGGRYSRAADVWIVTSLTNGTGTRVPTARFLHTAIWDGGEMIVWGGQSWDSTAVLNTGGRYSPVMDGWAVSSLTDATGVRVPSARQLHTAVWSPETGQLIVWGGTSDTAQGSGTVTDTGGLYCAMCPLSTWHADADHDGYGDPAAAIAGCSAPAGYVATTGDCNDANAAIHPGAPELCDGIDNDCDTVIDNGGDALCDDNNDCSADSCRGAGGCATPPSTVNLDVTGFSATRVDGLDLVILADAYNACPGDPRYNAAANLDQGTSGQASCVDMSDFHLFMNSFGRTCL